MAKITTKVEGQEIVIEAETADEAMRLYQLFHHKGDTAQWSLGASVVAPPKTESGTSFFPKWVEEALEVQKRKASEAPSPEPEITSEVIQDSKPWGRTATESRVAAAFDEMPRPKLVIGEGLTPTVDTKAVFAGYPKFKVGDRVRFTSGEAIGRIGTITQSGQRFVNPWIVISFPDGTDHKILGDDYSSIIEHFPEEPYVREVTNLPESQWAASGDEHAKLNVENGKASVSDVKMVRPPMSDLVFRTDAAGNTLPDRYINEPIPPAEKPWIPIRDFQVQNDPSKSRGRLVAEAAIKLDERQGTIVIISHDFPKSGAYGFKVDAQHRESILNFLHEYIGSHFDAEIERAVNGTVKKFRDATVQAFDKMDQDNCPLQAKGAREIYRILGLGFTGNK